MYLPKIPEETKFFKGGLWEFEYIRGALCSCSVDERKLFVTLDPRIFEGVPAPKLEQKKEDLRRIASELELCVSDKLTVLDFMDLIKNCDRYKNDPDSVHELANLIIEERKYDESQQLELEKIREKSKLDLEIARIRANDKDNNTEVNCNDSFSVDSLIKNQRKLQRILWRENMDEPIKTFELSTVTYGTTSAPFLATRTLKQLALDEAGNFPLGSSVVMSDMYIDDVLTGAETLLEAKELKNQLINIFAKGGMVLHKWCGNNTELIEVSENYDFSDSSEIKVLGVYWNPKHDCFSFRVKIDLHELNTKRDVLSTIARIYDPLGLLGPVVAKAKIFLQKLWMLKIDWTDLLPDTINREWRQFVESLQVVNDININRCIVVEQPEVIELHGFSDASQSAYGAVVYCKSITSDGKMLVHLIASKSRVAPTKQTTIPRLELCAAVLLAKLVHRVKQALKLNVTNTFF
ncbi:integrase_H2C2 domain-containing protein [Trichonephila clavipes]|nr:integrase_H2C2 domain-containing protein [Trichonephila clavipes]